MEPKCSLEAKLFMYACKVKETTNGSWRCACGEARQAFQVVAKRGIASNGEFDERKRVTKNREDEAQQAAEEETALAGVEALLS